MVEPIYASNICAPIKGVDEIWNVLQNPPFWTRRIIPLNPRSASVIDNSSLACHIEATKLQQRLDKDLVPRTLVCHDMKNGYLDDKYIETVNTGNGYTFHRWSQIDIFVYFSHHFITIPPLHWINLAHKNGVQIFGTLITEWGDGVELCKHFLKDLQSMRTFVSALVDLTILFNLDGWLLNIENPIENTSILLEFVKHLTQSMHKKKQGSKIIWYDSVIMDGSLRWQNELNINNRGYFDVCDGIFINYTWTEINLANTAKAAQHRLTDVYMGIDVFGRNTFGGGKFDCHIAAEKIRKLNMSMAIFAQGWTHETLSPNPSDDFFERFLHKDNSFWRSLWPYLYSHPVNRLFDTFFNVGSDKYKYSLPTQQVQLTRFLHAPTPAEYETTVSTLKNDTCNCLTLYIEKDKTFCLITTTANQLKVSHLFSCDITVENDILLYTFTKPEINKQNDYLNIIVLIQENGSFRKIVCDCSSKNRLNVGNFSLGRIYPCEDNSILNFSTMSYIPSNTALRCYHVQFNSKCRILEISGEVVYGNSVVLCGIGIQKYIK